MLDNSFLYNRDYKEQRKKLKGKHLEDLYSSLYSNARLYKSEKTQDYAKSLVNYSRNLELLRKLAKENHQLQKRVHELGIKNRIKKKLGLYRPPEITKLQIPQIDLENTISENYVGRILSFSEQALDIFNSLSDESFEEGLNRIQKDLASPIVKSPPLVSIIIPTRNGLHHLKRLFNNFDILTGYSNYEIIVVDNGSNDGTEEYLDSARSLLNLRVIKNKTNKSFSESNNIAARKAKGTYLLFLNNDVSPTWGWLNHLVNTALKEPKIGGVGAKLIYPYKEGFENSYKIQHGGIGFQLEDNFIRPINVSNGAGFFESNTKREEEKAGVTAACLLLEKKKFDEVDGFEEAYWYGYEDVDLCLKLRENGYRNVINNAAVLYHFEFGTQNTQSDKIVSDYRRKNMKIFKDKWQRKLYTKYWHSLLSEEDLYSNKRLHVGFIVTEANSKTAAGDYFTANELGIALENKGYRVSYIGMRDSPDPYEIDNDIDILISMIDGYDISRVNNKKSIKVAWCRNWFKRWAGHTYFRDFDIILSNSEDAREYFKITHHIDSYILKIAGNKDRFTAEYSKEAIADYESDICFTGNYWHNPRDIVELFEVEKFNGYKVKIFGKDWNHVKKFKPYHQGFLEYKDIPKVYAGGKILIDDATWIVSEWGSVNSRVFDGALSGILVLTNGQRGNINTFNGLLPTFSTKEELTTLLKKYLDSPKLREQKVNEIRNYALKHHTYDIRAEQLIKILQKELTSKAINIKLPIPRWSEAAQWGDLYFGMGIKKELEKKGFKVNLHILPEWKKPNFAYANIVLRGLSVFEPDDDKVNIMWNISHPDKVPLDEYRIYNYVFVASRLHADNLRAKGLNNVEVLYQCFDQSLFNTTATASDEKYKSDILFVGNTRNVFRKAVRDVLSWEKIDNYSLKIYGKGWEKFIDSKYIAGEFISNSELKYYYQNTKILLNDHWDDMNDYGFVSNRLFDASACGTFIISDRNDGIIDIFGKNVIEEYEYQNDLHNLLDIYLSQSRLRNQRSTMAKKIVSKKHTFANRIETFLNKVKGLH
jgi:O-antigen biosynthesis protein